tara:strand:+ start:2552 stop:3199 length:648 start_codon:yes stop_codon:yes gene_type:complete
MKTKIHLYGKISKHFGSTFNFANISKPIDCVKAIDSQKKGFINYIKQEAKKGIHYELIINGESQNAFSVNNIQEKIETIDIVPCIIGGTPAFFVAVFKVSLTTAKVLSAVTVTLALGLVVAGIVYLLTPIDVDPIREITASVKGDSFLFSSAENITQQGVPVPVGYGRLRVGSVVIATNVLNRNLQEEQSFSGSEDLFKLDSIELLQSLGYHKKT